MNKILTTPVIAFGLVLLVGVSFGLVQLATSYGDVGSQLPLTIILGGLAWLTLAGLIWWALRYSSSVGRRIPLTPQVLAFVWGAIVAVGFALVVNTAMSELVTTWGDTATTWSAAIVAPVVEETVKALGIIAIFLFVLKPRTAVDGFVIGALVGLGFQIVENMTYMVNAGIFGGGDSLEASGTVFFMRLISVPASHWAMSGIVGAGLALLFINRYTWPRRISLAAAALATGMVLHAVWNSPMPENVGLTLLKLTGALLLTFSVAMVTLWLARRSEAGVYSRYLVGQPEYVVTEAELAYLPTAKLRKQSIRAARQASGPYGATIVRRLQKMQLQLAVALAFADTDESNKLAAQIYYYRATYWGTPTPMQPVQTQAELTPA